MAHLPTLKELVLRDTPFANLMTRRVYNVLLLATKYDAFMLEDDGRVDEEIFNEYNALGLRYPPRFTQVSSEEEALARLAELHYELIIVMPNMAGRDIFASARTLRAHYPDTTLVVLTPFSKEVSKRFQHEDLTGIDYVFSWLGSAELLVAIIKLIEDRWNAPHDTAQAGVQHILLVEDSVRFYSSALPCLYRFVLEQSRDFAEEALNDQLKTMRMRGRPKILLARSYEEAMQLFGEYQDHILGVISDMSFQRCGHKDATAGYTFARHVRAVDRHIPIILQSSDDAARRYAQALGTRFISKNSKRYPQDLRREVTDHFGFGPFVIVDPQSGKPLMRLRTLHDLQHAIPHIPADALRYHLSHNHFSRFFFSRAMFPPAVILKKIDVADFADVTEARQFIADLIAGYRHLKNDGVVAIFQGSRFDEYASFARIGRGSLGGKGRGLAFMSAMLRRYPRIEGDTFSVAIPRTVVLCTDVFDRFMESADLYPLALSDASDADILSAFLRAPLPPDVLADLRALLRVVRGPLAVRSSSLLEDSHYQPFAGVYSTYMIPSPSADADRPATEDAQLALLADAIKGVYASVFYARSKTYLTATQNVIDQEKMAVVIQEVVGTPHGPRFYPTMSGVARSLNCYPLGDERPDDGVATVALGLGKYIVDGGRALRFSPRHPHHILQLSEPRLALREGQSAFLALDLTRRDVVLTTHDDDNLLRLPLAAAEADGTLRHACSTYDYRDDILRPGLHAGGRKVVTFQHLLQYDRFPVCRTIDTLLQIGRREMGRHVEIEFALDVRSDGSAAFRLLQLRPIVDVGEDTVADLSAVRPEDCLVMSSHVLGNGTIADVRDVLYVPSAAFDAAHNGEIAEQIRCVNARYGATDAGYILIGPGRWGSSDPWLGIPVQYPDITAARVIVERQLADYRVDPSQGTHFFQNLTSHGVGYFTLSHGASSSHFDEAYLESLPTLWEAPHLRLVRLPVPATVLMDGRQGRGVILKGGGIN